MILDSTNIQIENLPYFKDSKGILTPLEFKTLPFSPKRIFWTTDVPKGETRGNHAHYKTQQYVICICGEIEVTLYNGVIEKKVTIKENEGVFIDKLIWDAQSYLTGKDVLLVLCSTEYNKEDYIFSKEEFNNIVGRGTYI